MTCTGKQWMLIRPFKTLVFREENNEQYLYGALAETKRAFGKRRSWADLTTIQHRKYTVGRVDLSPEFLAKNYGARHFLEEVFPRLRQRKRLPKKTVTAIWTNMRGWLSIVGKSGIMMMEEINYPDILIKPRLLWNTLTKHLNLQIAG